MRTSSMSEPLNDNTAEGSIFATVAKTSPEIGQSVGGRITRPFLGGFGKPLIFVGPTEWLKRATRAPRQTDIYYGPTGFDIFIQISPATNEMSKKLSYCAVFLPPPSHTVPEGDPGLI